MIDKLNSIIENDKTSTQIKFIIDNSINLGGTDNFNYYSFSLSDESIIIRLPKKPAYYGRLDYRQDIFWCWSNVDDFIKRFVDNQIEFSVYSVRNYGEPKLIKPKELKGIKQALSVPYILNKCTCPVYIDNNDVWIKHRDYFSSAFKPPIVDIGLPTNAILKKYFAHSKTASKFVYEDNWGSVMLRSEAWLKIKNLYSHIDTKQTNMFPAYQNLQKTVDKFYKKDMVMSRFYEQLCNELYKLKKQQDK